jgi:hypothetical protein
MAANITSEIQSYAQTKYAGVKNTQYEEGDLEYEKYNPIFMNDSTHDQKPLQIYGKEAYERLKGIQRSADPEGVFAARMDGFKST